MTNKRATFLALTMCLLSLGGGLAIASTPPPPPPPPAPTVTITDNDANPVEPPVFHWNGFQTTLNTTVDNAPQSDKETTITGPDYLWSCSGPAPTFIVTNSDEATTTLLSMPNGELTAGTNVVTVSVTLTYTSTNKKTGVVTPISFPGSTDVKFFVRVPVTVKEISHKDVTNSPYNGPKLWGHDTLYHLQVQDNQLSPQPYTNGTVREEKVIGTIHNGPSPASTAFGGATNSTDPFGGKPAGVWSCPDIYDDIGCNTPKNLAATYGWTATTLQIAWDQKFWCDEATGHTTPLNTFHIENDYQTDTRN
jgi:hypothetical protein